MKSFIIFSILISSFLFGQNNLKNLRGNVTDFYKNPLQGVIVILKNESKFEYRKEAKPDSGDIIVPAMSLSPLSLCAGGETNIYGDYNFPVSYGEHILEISYPGFKTTLDTILVTKDTWDVHNYQLEQDYFDPEVITVNVPHSPINNNYIEAGIEFGFGLLINNVQAFGLNTFEFKCRFLSVDGSFYTFKIDSFRTRYENEYGEMIRTFTGLNEAGILKCSGKEKIKFAETLQEGIITFNIYTHFNQLIFKKDELYTICGEIHPGWPSSSSLFIKKDSSYLFLGLTDWKLNKSINMPEDFPLTIELNKVLIERNLIDSPFKYYNVLYKYSSGNEVILLNQNESGTLRDYIIYQGIARMQELNQPDHVDDGGVNGISFVIVKK